MTKLRNARRRQHARYMRYLVALSDRGVDVLVPDCIMRADNRDARRKLRLALNRARQRKEGS